MLAEILASKTAWAGAISGLLEGAGIPWPGGVVLTAAGVENTGLGAAVVIGTLFAIAYTASSALQYLLGRYCGELLNRCLSPVIRNRMDRAIERYGQIAVLWTRPLAMGGGHDRRRSLCGRPGCSRFSPAAARGGRHAESFGD